jgi:hypothetical protein
MLLRGCLMRAMQSIIWKVILAIASHEKGVNPAGCMTLSACHQKSEPRSDFQTPNFQGYA